MSTKRVDIPAILRDPKKRRELMVGSIIATQAREGVVTSREQAEAAYDKILNEIPSAADRGRAWQPTGEEPGCKRGTR